MAAVGVAVVADTRPLAAGRAGAIDDPVYIGSGAQGPRGTLPRLLELETIPLFVPF